MYFPFTSTTICTNCTVYSHKPQTKYYHQNNNRGQVMQWSNKIFNTLLLREMFAHIFLPKRQSTSFASAHFHEEMPSAINVLIWWETTSEHTHSWTKNYLQSNMSSMAIEFHFLHEDYFPSDSINIPYRVLLLIH